MDKYPKSPTSPGEGDHDTPTNLNQVHDIISSPEFSGIMRENQTSRSVHLDYEKSPEEPLILPASEAFGNNEDSQVNFIELRVTESKIDGPELSIHGSIHTSGYTIDIDAHNQKLYASIQPVGQSDNDSSLVSKEISITDITNLLKGIAPSLPTNPEVAEIDQLYEAVLGSGGIYGGSSEEIYAANYVDHTTMFASEIFITRNPGSADLLHRILFRISPEDTSQGYEVFIENSEVSGEEISEVDSPIYMTGHSKIVERSDESAQDLLDGKEIRLGVAYDPSHRSPRIFNEALDKACKDFLKIYPSLFPTK